jgi:hypothetical protein
MKGSDSFKTTINNFLIQRGNEDAEFLFSLGNEKKNIDDCITYIINTVQKSGRNGFTDDEIYGMAVHYYDEADIDVGKPITSGHVVVNHQVELTEEEKSDIKKKVMAEAIAKEQQRITKKPVIKTPVVQKVEQGSLF